MNNKPEKELYEKFTIEGFFAVSVWAFVFWLHSFWILDAFESYGITLTFKSALIFYLIVWFISFLLLCLIPKLTHSSK